MQIVNALYDLPIPKHNANPKSKVNKLDNIVMALKMVEDAKIKTNFLKSTHLVDKDLKMILGMMWAIILDYSIKGISEDDLSAKEGLLLWCRKKTKGYSHVCPPSITNFTTNWKNGLAFCALIHKHRPDLLDYSTLAAENAAENLELAFSVAEQQLGIPRLLEVSDLTIDRPDERSVMTQVSEYFHRFAQFDQREIAARRAANFIKFAKSMQELKNRYESSAREWLQWNDSTIQRFTLDQIGESYESASAANDALKQFILEEKPARTAAKMDLEALYGEIQAQLRVNHRSPYNCPSDITPDAIEEAFNLLWQAERQFANAARDARFRFIKKDDFKIPEEQLNEFKESFKHFDKNGNGLLEKAEFKAAVGAVNIAFKDEAHFEQIYNQVAEGNAQVNEHQYIRYLIEQNEDRDTPEQIKAAFKALANDAESISAQQLVQPPLTQEDAEFLAQYMPQAGDGNLDYNQYVDANFS
jgi:Ca2+-binding EF-hand superfamily protein